MKPWQMAAVLAVGWIVLMMVVGIVHTELLVPDMAPQEDSAVSYAYGQAAGIGAVLLAIGGYLFQQRRQGSGDGASQKVALLAVLVAMLVSTVLYARGGLLGSPRRDVRSAAFLNEVAAELNKQLPKAIDADTELVNITGLEGVFVYHYRLVNLSAGEVDGTALGAEMKPQVAKAACGMAETRDKFLKQGITLRYTYGDRTGTAITSFDVVPADCGFQR